MKKILLAMLTALLLPGCYSEKVLVPTQLESVLDKFDFPQGTSEADAIFERIYGKYGTKVIYKDFTRSDLERSWMNQAGANAGYATESVFEYITDPGELLEAAHTIEDKILGLFPEDIMREVLRAYPYIYLTDNLRRYDMAGGTFVEALYPVKALDGITINLQLDAAPDDAVPSDYEYKYRIYYPVRIAIEFFSQAFARKLITIPREFYTMTGTAGNDYLATWQTSMEDPARYGDYWARQGRVPNISLLGGIPSLRKSGGWHGNVLVDYSPLTPPDVDIPWVFVFLSTDRSWRTYDDEPGEVDETLTGIFHDCPLIVGRLGLFFNSMKEQGIDFDDIQRRLYDNENDNTTITKQPW